MTSTSGAADASWSPDRIGAALDLVRDGIVVLDERDVVVTVNAPAVERLGSDRSAVIGRNLFELIPGLRDTDFPAYLAMVRADSGSVAIDEFVHALAGWFEIHANVVGSDVVISVREVTGQRRLEMERDLTAQIDAAVAGSSTMSEMIGALARVLRVELRFDLAEVWIHSERRDHIRLVAADHDPDRSELGAFVREVGEQVDHAATPPARALTAHEVVIIDDLAADPTFARRAAVAGAGLRSALYAGVQVGGGSTLVFGLLRAGRIDVDDSAAGLDRVRNHLGAVVSQRRAQLELEQFFELSSEFVAITGLGGGFRRVNPAMIAELGYSERELLHSGFASLLHPDDVGRTEDAIARMVETGVPAEGFENRVRTATGDTRWISWNAQVFGDEGTVFSTGRDVTDERAERLYHEHQYEVLESLVAGAPLTSVLALVVRMLEAQDPSVMCSVQLFEPSNGDASEREGVLRVAAAPSLPDDYNTAIDGLAIGPTAGSCGAAAFRAEPVIVADIATDPVWEAMLGAARSADLAACWSIPILAADREVLGTLAVYSRRPGTPTDRQLALMDGAAQLAVVAIQRNRAELEARASEERFRLLSEVVTDAIWDWDIRAGTRWRSEGFFTLFGYEPMEIGGSDEWWLERVHPDDREHLRESRQRALDGTEEHWVGNYRFRCADGRYADVASRARVVRDADGQPIRMVGGMTDQSERRELERQYLRAQRVESLGTLAGGIAHDLNNSLMPISMAVELLQGADLDDDALDLLDVIATSARRSSDLVRNILAFARGLDGETEVLVLDEVVEQSVRLIRDTFPKDIDVSVHFGTDGVQVRGDSTQLHQVVMNLALNARDAMPDGGRLTITADVVTLDQGELTSIRADPSGGMAEVPAGRYARIRVGDTGTGMTPAVRDRLFEPFFTTKARTEGTGLGLPTSLAIARGHGGGIAVTVNEGGDEGGDDGASGGGAPGVTFDLYLAAELELVVIDHSEDDHLDEGRFDGDGSMVLVVDDEPAVRSVVRDVLESHGYRVVDASSGDDALRLHREHADEISVVLTDVMMPVMDGVRFVAHLNDLDPDLPVVAMTGLGEAQRAASLVSNGVHTVLHKPFDRSVLLATLAAARSGP